MADLDTLTIEAIRRSLSIPGVILINQVVPDATLADDLSIDSIGLQAIACALEADFTISIDDDLVAGWETVR